MVDQLIKLAGIKLTILKKFLIFSVFQIDLNLIPGSYSVANP